MTRLQILSFNHVQSVLCLMLESSRQRLRNKETEQKKAMLLEKKFLPSSFKPSVVNNRAERELLLQFFWLVSHIYKRLGA